MNTNGQTFFDDASRPVAVEEIDFAAMDARLAGEGQDDGKRERVAQQEAAIRILQVVCDGGATAEEAGRRAILLLQTLRPVKSQRAIARQLNMTPGRVSQLLNALRNQIGNGFNAID